MFGKLSTKCGSDFEKMAQFWAAEVDGLKEGIFPKVPAQLRVYSKKWDFNRQVKEALQNKAVARTQLDQRLGADPVPATTPAARPQPIFRPLSIMEPPAPPNPGPDPATIQQPVQQQPAQQGIAAQQGVAALLGAAAMLPPLPPAPPPEQQVGFLMFNAVPVVQQKERHGNRGKYKACRKPRACGQCRKYAKVERYQDECPGARYRQHCQFVPSSPRQCPRRHKATPPVPPARARPAP